MKDVLLPPNGIHQLIWTLCERPDLCEKISHVDLDDYTNTGPPKTLPRLAEWRHFRTCRNIVAAEVFDKIVRDEPGDGAQLLWSKNHRLLLDVLIASCPNLRKLSFKLPGNKQDPLSFISGECNRGRKPGSLQALLPNLVSINIVTTPQSLETCLLTPHRQ